MYNPVLTVLMSVYNGEKYLKAAISSILNQNYDEFKFLIIDNFSTDNSANIVQDFNDPRIELLMLPKTVTLAKALNKGLNKINTRFVARMDADDISKENRLSQQVKFLLDNPEIALLGTNCDYIDSDNKNIGNWNTNSTHNEIINSFSKFNPFAHSSVIFDRKKINKLGGYPEQFKYAQDLALWLKVCSKYKVANINQSLVKIRIHEDQATTDKKIEKIKLVEELMNAKSTLKIPGLFIRTKIQLLVRILIITIVSFRKNYEVK